MTKDKFPKLALQYYYY